VGDWHLFSGIVTDNGNSGYHDCELMTGYIFGSKYTSLFFADAVRKEIILFGKGYWGNGDYQGMDPKFFDGMIDDVRIYNRPLSEQELLELYDMATPAAEKKTQNNVSFIEGYIVKNVLHLNTPHRRKVSVRFYSSSGRCIGEVTGRLLQKGHNSMPLPFQAAGGVYTVRITAPGLEYTTHIVVM